MIKSKLKAWFLISRPPFHIVGISPFILGGILSWRYKGHLDFIILGWGILSVIFIMLATYYSGEYFDYEIDSLSGELERNRFSGGSQVLQTGIIPKRHVLFASYLSLFLGGLIGILLQFYYKTGHYTIPLGIIGMVSGFFYTTKPLQWSYRGVGEILIGFCYGWLTVASSYYIQTQKMSSMVHWISLPIALSIFNVILINEFPDYSADKEFGKKNLVVRFGKERMSKLYAGINIGAWISYFFSIKAGVPFNSLLLFSPVFILSIITTLQVFRGDYRDRKKLEEICAKTLIFNVGTTVSLIIAILLWI